MGRTDQVLTGGFLSYNPLSTTMKAVLALLLVCLVQISFAEEEDIAAEGASSDTNLLLQREVREVAKGNKGGCDMEDKKCKNKRIQMKKKTRKRLRKQQKKVKKNQKSGRKNKTSKEGNNGAKKGGKKGRKNKKGKKL